MDSFYERDPKLFAYRLEEELKKRHMTQDELALLTDTHPMAVSYWINGRTLPSITKACAVADVLKMPLDSLFTADSTTDTHHGL